jgi:hypothetical protein
MASPASVHEANTEMPFTETDKVAPLLTIQAAPQNAHAAMAREIGPPRNHPRGVTDQRRHRAGGAGRRMSRCGRDTRGVYGDAAYVFCDLKGNVPGSDRGLR